MEFISEIIENIHAKNEFIHSLVLSDGVNYHLNQSVINCDMLLIGVGAVPRTVNKYLF